MTTDSTRQQADIVFPVRVVRGIVSITQHNGRTRRCAERLWYRDWYDARRTGPDGRRRAHHAQDIFAPSGSDVLALEDGAVLASSHARGPSALGGHWLQLRGQDGRTWYMAHLALPAYVRPGQTVTQGQLVGRVGRSGNATHGCPHLHLGLKINGRPANAFPALQRVDPTRAPAAPADRGETRTA